MENEYVKNRHMRNRLLILLVVSTCIAIFGSAAAINVLEPFINISMQHDEENLDNDLHNLASYIDFENSRQSDIQKIIKISERYNKNMPMEERKQIAAEIRDMSVKYSNLDIDLICATITHESAKTWDANVVSQAGAMGLMQIMPATGAFLAQEEGINWTSAKDILFNPIYNIRLGCRYLSGLVTDFELDGGLAAYNGGAKRAVMWISSGKDMNVLWEETRGYIPAILSLYREYRSRGGIL